MPRFTIELDRLEEIIERAKQEMRTNAGRDRLTLEYVEKDGRLKIYQTCYYAECNPTQYTQLPDLQQPNI